MGARLAHFRILLILVPLLLVLSFLFLRNSNNKKPWIRHTIDNSSRGADGVKLGDVNQDGLADIATPYEQGGLVRLYLNPGPEKSKQPWTAITVGTVPSPEDAVLFDFDKDGMMDVVSACEGKVRSIFFHHAPTISSQYLDSKSWTKKPLMESQNTKQWMFLVPAQIDGQRGLDREFRHSRPGEPQPHRLYGTIRPEWPLRWLPDRSTNGNRNRVEYANSSL